MSEAHRSEVARVDDAAHDADRDAKIEQLLLVGLDHYFAARYELAINVWTRALFIDRSHPRARAYIDRARSALAERQRESEELLQTGVAAFQRGDADEARRLLHAAIDGGAPSEEALAVLERLNRLETAGSPPASRRADRPPRAGSSPAAEVRRRSPLLRVVVAVLLLAAISGGAVFAAARAGINVRSWLDLRSVVALTGDFASREPSAPAPIARETVLVLPRRGEMILASARSLVAGGYFHDALTVLDSMRPTDPQRADADRLRADIQRQLVALATLPSVPEPAPPARGRGNRPVP
jgi:tetratricopeptide (TPR) repeat protein